VVCSAFQASLSLLILVTAYIVQQRFQPFVEAKGMSDSAQSAALALHVSAVQQQQQQHVRGHPQLLATPQRRALSQASSNRRPRSTVTDRNPGSNIVSASLSTGAAAPIGPTSVVDRVLKVILLKVRVLDDLLTFVLLLGP
jgi:hypothetical protein